MKKTTFYVLVLVLMVAAACKDTIDIGEINKEPGKYLDKRCTVEGVVTTVLDIPIVKYDFFKIHDEKDEIWIYTEKGVPPEGKKLQVKGLLKKLIGFDIPIIKIEAKYYIELQELKFL